VTLARRLNTKTNAVGTHFVRKKIKKCLVLGPRIPILWGMEDNFINELNRNAKARFQAKMFKFLLETAHHSLPFSVTAEQEEAFKKALGERLAKQEAIANETFGK
jgi:sugar phosphate isomerase/epimerase